MTISEYEDIEKFYNLVQNQSEKTNSVDETVNISEEEDILEGVLSSCQSNDTACIITRLLLAVAIISLVVLAVAVYWDKTKERCHLKNQAENRILI